MTTFQVSSNINQTRRAPSIEYKLFSSLNSVGSSLSRHNLSLILVSQIFFNNFIQFILDWCRYFKIFEVDLKDWLDDDSQDLENFCRRYIWFVIPLKSLYPKNICIYIFFLFRKSILIYPCSWSLMRPNYLPVLIIRILNVKILNKYDSGLHILYSVYIHIS